MSKVIPIGMLRTTIRDGYGRNITCMINPLEVEGIIGRFDGTVVSLVSGRKIVVLESPIVLEKAWANLMRNITDESEHEGGEERLSDDEYSRLTHCEQRKQELTKKGVEK